ARLQLSRRTLQDYRNNGVIPYIQLGGKILYRESDIQKILMANYREAYRMKGL
ncbi:helix-turn-helix domain-containing protein, partial [Bacteroides ovatus]